MTKRTKTQSHGEDPSNPKRRKQDDITTQSILHSFLIQKITLDETITNESLIKALKAESNEKKKSKKLSADSHPSISYLVRDLNLQRLAIRKEVEGRIQDFYKAYEDFEGDNEADNGEDEDDFASYDNDVEQMALLKEGISVAEAIKSLKIAHEALEGSCAQLKADIAKQKGDLTKTVDELAQSLSK